MGKDSVGGAAKQKRGSRQNKELKFEVVQGPEMTPDQVDGVAHILARMWISDFERRRNAEIEGKGTAANQWSQSTCEDSSVDWTYE
jgi:hypothetical protein